MKTLIGIYITAFSSFFIGVATFLAISEGYLNIGNRVAKAKLECESTLPRNQHCEIIIKAVPVEE